MKYLTKKKVSGMKVRYLGKSDPLELIHGKVYDVISIDSFFGLDDYAIVDETGEDYLYPTDEFGIVQEGDVLETWEYEHDDEGYRTNTPPRKI